MVPDKLKPSYILKCAGAFFVLMWHYSIQFSEFGGWIAFVMKDGRVLYRSIGFPSYETAEEWARSQVGVRELNALLRWEDEGGKL